MGFKIIKKDQTPEEKMKQSVDSGSYMSEDDLLETAMKKAKLAKKLIPNYEELKEEIQTYEVPLPNEFTEKDLSSVNKLYSLGQEFASRVTTLEHIAIGNHSRWQRVFNLMQDYIKEKECAVMVTNEVKELSNAAMREAFVRNKLKKLYKTQTKIRDYMYEAEAFKRIVESKKQDLKLVLMNLTRQVKVVQEEIALTKN